MQTMISIVLLLKSLFKREYTRMDVVIAYACTLFWQQDKDGPVPAWLEMIANLKDPAILPEVWADFRFDLKAGLFGGE